MADQQRNRTHFLSVLFHMKGMNLKIPTTTTTSPIVTSYPENIKNNIDPIIENEVDFIHPFLYF